jgi:predicted nucleic acid-binding protein
MDRQQASQANSSRQAIWPHDQVVMVSKLTLSAVGLHLLEGQHLTSETKSTLGPRGAIVAATGLVHNDLVVTNDSDFRSVECLTVERY